MNRYWVAYVIVALPILADCRNRSIERAVAGAPTIGQLLYCRWEGMSKGAGFSRTYLDAIQVDMPGKRYRRITRSASVPEPMLPYQQAEVSALLEDTDWVALAPDTVRHLTMIARIWLETHPPPAYTQPRVLGREDGCAETLALQMNGENLSVNINVRGNVNDPLRPPPEWHALVAYLDALRACAAFPPQFGAPH